MNEESEESNNIALKPTGPVKELPPSFLEMRYKTCECGTTFYKDSDLYNHFNETKHKIITRDVSTYQCNICTRVFDTKTSIQQHHAMTHIYNFRETHPSLKVCEICGAVMKSLLGIRSHMGTHNGHKKFKCHLCVKSFDKRDRLQIHINRHLGIRNFACEECPLKFVTLQHLNRHMMIHKGIKPHGCPKCSKRFSQKVALTNHFNSIHLNIKIPKKQKKTPGTGRPRITINNYQSLLNKT